MLRRLLLDFFRIADDQDRVSRQMADQADQLLPKPFFRIPVRIPVQQPGFVAGRNRDARHFISGQLGKRVEFPNRVDFVPEKLQPERPGISHRKYVHDASALSHFPFLSHLSFRFIGHGLQPLDQFAGVKRLPYPQRPDALLQAFGGKGFLQQSQHVGDDGRGPIPGIGQVQHHFQAFAHRFQRIHRILSGAFVRREGKRQVRVRFFGSGCSGPLPQPIKPSAKILAHAFLQLGAGRDQQNRRIRFQAMNQRR